MANTTIKVRVKHKTDTESNWSSKNPVLLKGEYGLIDGSSKYKIGDGITAWKNLPLYQAMSPDVITKLDSVESGANKTIVDATLSATSTNALQNKAINSAINTLTSKLAGKVTCENATDFAQASTPAFQENINSYRSELDSLQTEVDTLNQGGLNMKNDLITTLVFQWMQEHAEFAGTIIIYDTHQPTGCGNGTVWIA